MPLLPYASNIPRVHERTFVAPTAFVVGRVEMGEDCSVWFGSTIRADTGAVGIGRRVNVQECCTIHTQADADAVIGDGVSMGHHALVHGAMVGDDVLIGINASILSGARIGPGSIIAAHALVGEGVEIPPRSLVVGVPGRVVRETTDTDLDRIRSTAENYRRLGQEYAQLLRGD